MGSQRGDGQVYDIPPVYFIGLLDKDLQDMQRYSPEDSIISEYTFREKTTMMVPDETIFTIFVELNRFTKTKEECETMLDKWCFAFQACEIARFEPEVKLKYEKEMITERDYYNMLNTAKADGLAAGLAEGEAKGLAEGEAKGRAEIIRKMQDSGMDNETILRITGISPESILRLSRDA